MRARDEFPKGKGEIARRLVPLRGILFEAVTENRVRLCRNPSGGLRQPFRFVSQNGDEGFGGRGTLECAPSRQHLVKHAAEGEDVGAGVRALAAYLLG